MPAKQRTTIYLQPQLHRALRLKAATTNRKLSDLVNEAVRLSLREDVSDEEAYRRSKKQPSRPFSEFLRELKRARAI